MRIQHRHPWLIADLGSEMRALSWAPYQAGFVDTTRVVWRQVRNADLTRELDVTSWLKSETAAAGFRDAVALLTSRDVAKHHFSRHTIAGVAAECLATVGLGNAERVGHRAATKSASFGTINLLAGVSRGLSDVAFLEALSIAAEARTLAVAEVGHVVADGIATGTGTDCIVVAAPKGSVEHVGKHTEIGEALGKAVFEAVSLGAQKWMTENR